MLVRRLHNVVIGVVLSTALVLSIPLVATAAPADDLAAKQAEVDRAVRDYQEGQARLQRIQKKIAEGSSELDSLVEAQARAQTRLSIRAQTMYRTGEISFVSVVMGAQSFEDFATRWAMLTRINEEDAQAIAELVRSRKRVARSAKELLELQEDAAKQMRALDRKAAKARKQLAGSKAAYAAYRLRLSSGSSAASTPARPQPRGKGAWKSAVASHYGANFTGRGASGERIGPNSMIVAHKTLPFGTLVEIRYSGKTAVAKVADRGPYTKGRTFDLGPGVIKVLGFSGVHSVQYRVIAK